MKKLTLTLSLIMAVILGGLVGIAFMGMGHESADGEYFRALKTIGGSGVNWIDAVFRYCVVLLVNSAKILGISYEAINIWVFMIIQPLIIILLFIWALQLRRKVKKLEK